MTELTNSKKFMFVPLDNTQVAFSKTKIKLLIIIALIFFLGLFIGALAFDSLVAAGVGYTPAWALYILNIIAPIWIMIYLVYILLLMRPKLIGKRIQIFKIVSYASLNFVIILIIHTQTVPKYKSTL